MVFQQFCSYFVNKDFFIRVLGIQFLCVLVVIDIMPCSVILGVALMQGSFVIARS